MDGVHSRGFWESLEQQALIWLHQGRIPTKKACEPVIRTLLYANFGIAPDEAVEYYAAEFCALVIRYRAMPLQRRARFSQG